MASQITSLTIVNSRWIPRTKGQWRGKCFHFMTSLLFSEWISLRCSIQVVEPFACCMVVRFCVHNSKWLWFSGLGILETNYLRISLCLCMFMALVTALIHRRNLNCFKWYFAKFRSRDILCINHRVPFKFGRYVGRNRYIRQITERSEILKTDFAASRLRGILRLEVLPGIGNSPMVFGLIHLRDFKSITDQYRWKMKCKYCFVKTIKHVRSWNIRGGLLKVCSLLYK